MRGRAGRLRALALCLALSVAAPLALPLLQETAEAARKKRPRRPTRAEREAEKRRREAARRAEQARLRAALEKVWQPEQGCYKAGTVFYQPSLLDHDPIDIPRSARGGALKAALLMYEAQVDKSGRLHSLRTLRPLPRTAPWPALHEAVVSSVRGWKWAKTRVAGKTLPVCFPLTLNLDLR